MGLAWWGASAPPESVVVHSLGGSYAHPYSGILPWMPKILPPSLLVQESAPTWSLGWELLSHKYPAADTLCKRQQNWSVAQENKGFSCLRDKEITSAMVRERAGAAVPSAPEGRGCPQWYLLPPCWEGARAQPLQAAVPLTLTWKLPMRFQWSGTCSDIQSKGRACWEGHR